MGFKEVQGFEEVEIDNVTAGVFPLSQSPITYQLTIHINNLLTQYGKQSTATFKAALTNPDELNEWSDLDFRVSQIILHYGPDAVQSWFKLIHGWTFSEVA